MRQHSTQFSPPSISSIYAFLLVMACLTMIFLYMPPYFLAVAITINLTIPLVTVCIALYTHRLAHVASLSPLLGLSIFFRLAISITMFRYFCTYKIWDDTIWKNANDLFNGFVPAYVAEFTNLIGNGNVLYSSIICLTLCATATIALISVFIASIWTKPLTSLELQVIQTKQEATIISSEAASREQESIIQDSHSFSSLRGATLLLSLEAILGLVIALFMASSTMVLANQSAQDVLRFWDLPITGHSLTLNTKLLTFSIILGSEALIRGIPLLLTSLSLWLLLSRRDSKAQGLGEQVMETLTLHPYSLLFAAFVLTYIGFSSILFGGEARWYLYFPISTILVAIAFSVFLSADVQERLNQLEQALAKRKALLGLLQPASSITLEVSEAISKHFHLYHVDSVRLEDLNHYPSGPTKPTNDWQARLENLTYLNRRVKFMHSVHKRLITEPGSGSELLHQLQSLYANLEQELGHSIVPIHIQINNTLVNSQYRLLVEKKVQTQGEISLSKEEALNIQAIQDLIQQLKAALLSKTIQE